MTWQELCQSESECEQCILSLSILTKFLEKDLEQSKPFAVAIELCINLLLPDEMLIALLILLLATL